MGFGHIFSERLSKNSNRKGESVEPVDAFRRPGWTEPVGVKIEPRSITAYPVLESELELIESRESPIAVTAASLSFSTAVTLGAAVGTQSLSLTIDTCFLVGSAVFGVLAAVFGFRARQAMNEKRHLIEQIRRGSGVDPPSSS
jgi:hypothetical protein